MICFDAWYKCKQTADDYHYLIHWKMFTYLEFGLHHEMNEYYYLLKYLKQNRYHLIFAPAPMESIIWSLLHPSPTIESSGMGGYCYFLNFGLILASLEIYLLMLIIGNPCLMFPGLSCFLTFDEKLELLWSSLVLINFVPLVIWRKNWNSTNYWQFNKNYIFEDQLTTYYSTVYICYLPTYFLQLLMTYIIRYLFWFLDYVLKSATFSIYDNYF